MIRKLIPLLVILVVLIWVAGSLSLAAPPSPAPDWQSKVDPWVLDKAASGQAEFLVYLTEQADLSRAADLPTKLEKGTFVFETLSKLAAETQTPILAALKARGVEHRSYWVANMIWVRGDLATVQDMARRPDVAHIYANPAVRFAGPISQGDSSTAGALADEGQDAAAPAGIEWNISHVNAPDVWAAGYTGQGAVIAGQDTGYQWDHPALINQYRGWDGGTADHDYNWHDAIHSGGGVCGADSPFPCDDHNHGTHTMGTMVGDDGGSNRIGMAPGARWIGCRNMDQGVGTPATYSECYQWFIAPTRVDGSHPDPAMAPHVINNSWGCPPSEGCTDPNVLLTVVDNVRAAGIVTIQSAGNAGPACSSVSEPAAIYGASFAVGATNSSDSIASFSSRGPVTIDGSNRLKPNVSAPGVSIRSSVRGSSYQGGWQGTSMAGPHVAGLVALLISANTALADDVDALEQTIEQTALPLTSTQTCGGVPGSSVPNNTFGWGRIDALAAYEAIKTPFVLEVTPLSQDVCAPADALFDVAVAQNVAGFGDPVTLTAGGVPAGARSSFSVNPVTPPGNSLLTISDTATAAPGSYVIDVAGSRPTHTLTTTVRLNLAMAAPRAVTLLAPANGASNVASSPTFTWTLEPGASSYEIEIATDSGFLNVVRTATGLSSPSYTPDAPLDSSTTYFWRVTAVNGCGRSESDVFNFTTAAAPGDCGPGLVPNLLYSEDFEAGSAGWTHDGTGDTWQLSGTRTRSGVAAYHAEDTDAVSDQRLVSPAVTLPTGQAPLSLKFWNYQEMEGRSVGGCYDGGILEISTDGGTTWTQLEAELQTDPYDGPVSTTYGNPLAGLNAWCGDPQDWLNSVVDLDAYAGQTVQFRFRLGSDSSVGREGWTIDDVVVQGCQAPTAVTLAGLNAGQSGASASAGLPLAAVPAAIGFALAVAGWLARRPIHQALGVGND